jgi:hypothetical protein
MQGMAKTPTRHHLSVGVLAAILGVALGVGVVYLDQKEARPVFAQGSGSCTQQEQACVKAETPYSTCHAQWVQCMTNKCMGGAGAVGQCVQDPECQASCTESATSQGGKISCCEGGPKHGNTCRDKVDGKCNPKQTELEKGKEEGKGGPEMPKLPEMPKGGGGEPKPKEDPCAQGASSSECKATQAPSGVSGFLGNLFGTNSGTESTGTNSVSSALQSAASKLQSFFSGESSTAVNTDNTNTVQNPTQAVVTPVTPSASQAGQITSQSGGSQQGTTNTSGTTGVGGTVTGFGSGAPTDVNTQSGPIVAAMKGIVTRIQGILSSLFK